MPQPDQILNFTQKDEQFSYGKYSVGKHTKDGNFLSIGIQYNQQPKYGPIKPPPVYAHRYITGRFLRYKNNFRCVTRAWARGTNELVFWQDKDLQ